MPNHVVVYQLGVDGVITPNATQYPIPGAGPPAANECGLRVTRGGTVKNLYVCQRVASGGAGWTDIYTARIDGVDTTITCTLDNELDGEDTVNTAAITAGQELSVSLVSNNPGDSSEDVFITIKVEFSN